MPNYLNDNYFGDNYHNFDNYTNHSYMNPNLNGSPMRPQMPPKEVHNYGNRNPVNASRRPNNGHNVRHNYYRRTQPYYGPNGGPIANQYRAQVIDYSNGTQPQPNRPYNRNAVTNNSSQPLMTGPPSGLLPLPTAYPNVRPYGQTSQPYMPNANVVQMPTHSQPFNSSYGSQPPPQQQMNSYASSNQSVPQYGASMPYSHTIPQPVPQPVPPPPPMVAPQPVPPPSRTPLFPIQAPTPVGPPNRTQPNVPKVKVEIDVESQRLSDETRAQKIIAEGMQHRFQNDLNGYYCLFCDVFCNNLSAGERHVETPKHHRTKIGDNLKGIDAKYTIKSERINETAVALARKEELSKISNVIKNEYFNEGIRLKDGIGSDAYVCESCGIPIASLVLVKKHLELHKQLSEQLGICTKPVIGLDFICEYIDPDPDTPRVYECALCNTTNTSKEIINHICGFTHITNFIKRIHPKEGIKFMSETPELVLEAAKQAIELEMVVGRGHFKVKHQSAPRNYNNRNSSLDQIKSNYNSLAPSPSPVPQKAVFQIELPKVKSEEEKSSLEKLFCVRLESESDANEVTKLIETITNCVLDYLTKDMVPQQRDQFRRQLNSDNALNTSTQTQ